MIIPLDTIRKTIIQFSEGLIPKENINMAAEQIWSAVHELADAEYVICPKCRRGTLRPILINIKELALGCDECQYKETAE